MKIKSNKKLFNKWKRLGNKVSFLGSIVQNDMEISIGTIGEFKNLAFERTKDIIDLWFETEQYLSEQYLLENKEDD